MIYLNNAATTWPKPKEVIEAVAQNIISTPCHGSRTGLEVEDDDIFYQCRKNLANFFNVADPLRFVFTSGSTEALNLAIKGCIPKGSHAVTTMIEHNSVIRPLKTMEERGELELTFVPCDAQGYVRPEDIESAIIKKTKTIVVNHCSNVTGALLDLQAISEIAQKRNIRLIVDGSQSSGNVPIDLTAIGVDLFAFTGHKSLYGVSGIGGLYIKPDIGFDDLLPLKTGGTGVKSEVLTQPREMTMYYEAGTPNMPGVAALNAGINWINSVGFEKIRERKKGYVKRMIAELCDLPEVTIYNHPERSSFANFCFNLGNMAPEEVGYALESSFDIHVRSGLHCAPLLLEPLGVYPWGTVRASPSYFNTDEEIEKFIDAIKQVIDSFIRRK